MRVRNVCSILAVLVFSPFLLKLFMIFPPIARFQWDRKNTPIYFFMLMTCFVFFLILQTSFNYDFSLYVGTQSRLG